MYTAAVLTQQSCDLLKASFAKFFDASAEGYLFQTQRGDPLPHHMTINMGSLDPVLNPNFFVGDEVILKIDRFYVDADLGVCAAEVFFAGRTVRLAGNRTDYSINTINDLESRKHITLCIQLCAKPFLSNKIKWSTALPFHPETKSGVFRIPAKEGYLSLDAKIEECQ